MQKGEEGGKGGKTVTRRRWNERRNAKQGRQRGAGSLAFCSHLLNKLDKIHVVVLTVGKRNGQFSVF